MRRTRAGRHGCQNRRRVLSFESELVIIGAGPAGVGAALAATESGVETAILDEAPTSGGQVYRALPPEFVPLPGVSLGPDHVMGAEQRRRLIASPALKAFGRRVWNVAPDLRVDALGPDGPEAWQARALVVATGTTERVVPFAGWTLPGVIGLAAATVLLKSQQVMPGERTLVAGCGPLLAAVAVGILKAGGKVEAMIDLSGPADWLRALPSMTARPDLLWRGFGWARLVRAAGVPMLFRHGIRAVRDTGTDLEIEVVPVDASCRPKFDTRPRRLRADAVTVGHGLVPATEITRLLRAEHRFCGERGGWIAIRDADMRTTLDRVYVAGDGGGIAGAAAAFLQGQIAGLAAAHELGRLTSNAFRAAAAPLRKAQKRAERFGHAMAALMALRPGQLDDMRGDTIVCRCEDISRSEIEAAVAGGAREVNQLKAWTRCGMGPCQGRMCGEIAATLVAQRVGGRENAGIFTARAPIRPVPLSALAGEYDYADIPIPRAAPL